MKVKIFELAFFFLFGLICAQAPGVRARSAAQRSVRIKNHSGENRRSLAGSF